MRQFLHSPINDAHINTDIFVSLPQRHSFSSEINPLLHQFDLHTQLNVTLFTLNTHTHKNQEQTVKFTH